MNTQRQAIIGALSTVTGIAAQATLSGPIMAGQAWPAWLSTRWATHCQQVTSWSVFVALPNSISDATVDAGDELVQAVAAALFTVGKVSTVEPFSWPAQSNQESVPVLRFLLEV